MGKNLGENKQIMKKAIFLILLIALLLRLINISQSLWLDETISATFARDLSFFRIITQFSLSDTHPPLYYLVLRAWSLVFGFSEASLRMPSVIFGVLTVYLTYKIGKVLAGKKVGTLSALFMSTAPLHIYYSQEARMYSFSTLAVSLVVYFFLKKKWFLLSLAILLVGMIDYLPLFILIPLWFYLIVTKDKYSLFDFAKAHIPLILFFSLWLPYFFHQIKWTSIYVEQNSEWKQVLGSGNLKELALVWVKFIIGRMSFANKLHYSLVASFLSIIFGMAFVLAFKYRKKVIFLWFWFIVPLAVSFIGSIFIPGFSYFRLLFLIPAFYLLIAYGISKSKFTKLLVGLIFTTNLVFTSIYLFNSNYWREDWKGLVSFIESRIEGEEKVYASHLGAFTPYLWYAKRGDIILRFGESSVIDSNSFYSLDYLMDLSDPNRKIYQVLKDYGYKDIQVYNFRGVGQVRYWVKSI
ncbi:hypothetical protein A3A75_04975 [Candidatus Woesebacteria bacterium RIFCSPLOWO2_01_FULL_39_10]|uniref:Glycosyltransferase RgtA/B/C/D-like domain-containing protein n=1 Tax=Candidatus Woesebacteria bacterium RIFCSPLOWO2_01_FULL_39_10 TaxID=1802516 RepID=A0A1F8B2V2_9BACT|nr:MAG: hypothetical protein A3A75_04975 [Candidatus Woesebacteria bacterium RIFCSPLOWO2_01_FULL_39_10]